MAQTLSDAISSFSQKFQKFSRQSNQSRNPVPTENSLLQSQIDEREGRLKSAVLSTYKIYKSPYEALGKDSKRAKAIDNDELLLLKAYNLFEGVFKANSEKADEGTFLRTMEISSPLSDKYSYTSGGQFVYLICWLMFEQNKKEFIPEFFEYETGKYSLVFFQGEKYEFDQKMKEVISIIESNFYAA